MTATDNVDQHLQNINSNIFLQQQQQQQQQSIDMIAESAVHASPWMVFSDGNQQEMDYYCYSLNPSYLPHLSDHSETFNPLKFLDNGCSNELQTGELTSGKTTPEAEGELCVNPLSWFDVSNAPKTTTYTTPTASLPIPSSRAY
eukprot:TRINITY_DN9806_c0_g1_i1.p1 TRINITY_DN9806_c0_g1~~TRINITY_DN9806_c0_g1_i1.p1  ORF type:complete len:161 (+),score=14.47 TRINITY_DN9806_c0_g1_i1:52-483(+)